MAPAECSSWSLCNPHLWERALGFGGARTALPWMDWWTEEVCGWVCVIQAGLLRDSCSELVTYLVLQAWELTCWETTQFFLILVK